MKNVKTTDCTCGKEEVLPSRFARATITGGDTYNRALNNYAKKATTPRLGVMTGFSITMGK